MDDNRFYSSKYAGTKAFTQQNIHTASATRFGAAADDHIERGIDLNEELIQNKPATFFMRVGCGNMMEAGIHKGDVVIVDRSVKAVSGKVIIAVLNGDMIIRRLEKIHNRIRLLADAGKLAPLLIDSSSEDFAIWGVVTYVIHRP
jgi:DNA polymerase V